MRGVGALEVVAASERDDEEALRVDLLRERTPPLLRRKQPLVLTPARH